MSEYSSFDYISDMPTTTKAWELTQAYPNAVYMMGLRDPYDWQESRIKHHVNDFKKDEYWHVAQPCSIAPEATEDERTPTAVVTYNAWVRCMLPADRLFAYNV